MENMKKLITSLLLIVLLFNFIFLNSSYGAAEDEDAGDSVLAQEAPPSDGMMDSILDDGTAAHKQDDTIKTTLSFSNFGSSIVGFVLGLLSRLFNAVIALELDIIFGQLTFTVENGELQYFVTIDRLVFNRIPLLNANYFNTKDTYKVGDLELPINNNNKLIKESIARVYTICRILALIIGLAVLVYIGIRMAISTVASEQAKYKKMLIGWFESIVIIFAMPYIMVALFTIEEVLIGVFYELRNSLMGGNTDQVFENVVRNIVLELVFSASGIELTMWSIMYWVLLYMEIKFLWTYTKRFFMIGFLIAIAPLVTITYSIDKAGDGKAQAFSNWLKEFMLNVLIQPLHAIIFLVIVMTANNIAAKAPIIAIFLLLSMGTVERMVRVVFNVNDSITFNGIRDRLFKKGK